MGLAEKREARQERLRQRYSFLGERCQMMTAWQTGSMSIMYLHNKEIERVKEIFSCLRLYIETCMYVVYLIHDECIETSFVGLRETTVGPVLQSPALSSGCLPVVARA